MMKHKIYSKNCINGTMYLPYFVVSTLVTLVAFSVAIYAHKVPTGDDCINSNVFCYECDSRNDPNCKDPFDFPPNESPNLIGPNKGANSSYSQAFTMSPNFEYSKQTATNDTRQRKQLPPVQVCHGCCVKLTSKLGDGSTYVRRTCTTSLQINYFMVGLICMKESGDRGKMCFCETDYCNGQSTKFPILDSNELLILTLCLIASISIVRFQEHDSHHPIRMMIHNK